VPRYGWTRLGKQQVGAYTEYFVKMELTMYGFQVYETEVDDRGVDFVTRYERGQFLEIQVKSLRGPGYAFVQKSKIQLGERCLVALGLLQEGEPPQLYLIPSTVWLSPNACFVDRNYEGLQSSPEWGINVSGRNMQHLQQYSFELTVQRLIDEAKG
jgi:hypothetical protein